MFGTLAGLFTASPEEPARLAHAPAPCGIVVGVRGVTGDTFKLFEEGWLETGEGDKGFF